MTTLAVNEHTVIPTRKEEYVYQVDGTIYHDYGLNDGSEARRVRPASVSNPANPINGWRAPGPWSHQGFKMFMPAGEFSFWFYKGHPVYASKYVRTGYSWVNVNRSIPPLPGNEFYARAVDKAISKINNQKVNLGQMVLEAGETSELMVSTIRKAVTLVKAFKSKSPKAFLWAKTIGSKPGHRGSKIPDAYLEYVYGVKPLIQDAHGALEAFRTRGQSRPPAFSVEGKSGAKDSGISYLTHGSLNSARLMVEWNQTQSVKVRMDLELVNPFTATLASLGILNPAALAWERLPFSFVADWFVPVGQWLGHLDAGLGCQFKGGSVSYITHRSERSTGFTGPADNPPYTDFNWSGSRYSYEGFNFRRDVLYSVPFGTVYLKNPFPKNGIHIANAVALLVGALR